MCDVSKNSLLEAEFFDLAKLYYEGRKFTGPLRPIMARDFRKARDKYMLLCQSGTADKDSVKCEIEDYLRWLEKNKCRRKQKLWSFMESPYRDWEAAKETAKLRKIKWESDLETKITFINLDQFTTPEEKKQQIEKLRNGECKKPKEDDSYFEFLDPFGFDSEEERRAALNKKRAEKGLDPIVFEEDIDTKKKSLPTKQLEREFDEIWNFYPRKLGKENAKKDFFKFRNEGVTFEAILDGVKKYFDYVVDNQIEDQFIKHGSTWFHQKCWEDVYETNTKDAHEKAKREASEAFNRRMGIVEYG